LRCAAGSKGDGALGEVSLPAAGGTTSWERPLHRGSLHTAWHRRTPFFRPDFREMRKLFSGPPQILQRRLSDG